MNAEASAALMHVVQDAKAQQQRSWAQDVEYDFEQLRKQELHEAAKDTVNKLWPSPFPL